MKCAVVLLAILALVTCDQARRRHEDPFAALDKHISHSLAFHYLWPWSQLMNAAAALGDEDNIEEPQIKTDPKQFEISLNVRRFKPDELRIKVKNRNIIVEGKHKETQDDNRFMANHFVQRFALPAGSKQEEVTAVLKENGILSISAPRHELPPPPPERIIPIEVRLPSTTTEKEISTEEPTTESKIETSTERKEASTEKKPESSSQAPLEEYRLVEATTHVGKIRKKELKNSAKTVRGNEVSKRLEDNGLDYALIETE